MKLRIVLVALLAVPFFTVGASDTADAAKRRVVRVAKLPAPAWPRCDARSCDPLSMVMMTAMMPMRMFETGVGR